MLSKLSKHFNFNRTLLSLSHGNSQLSKNLNVALMRSSPFLYQQSELRLFSSDDYSNENPSFQNVSFMK